MILEYYWIYYIAFCVSGIIFTLPMEKREGFRKKLAIFWVLSFLFGVLTLHLPNANVMSASEVNTYALLNNKAIILTESSLDVINKF